MSLQALQAALKEARSRGVDEASIEKAEKKLQNLQEQAAQKKAEDALQAAASGKDIPALQAAIATAESMKVGSKAGHLLPCIV